MIEKGAIDWNCGLGGACEGGDLNLMKLMIEKGAKFCDHCQDSPKNHIHPKEHLQQP
jgi:hypothetical protein